METPRGSVPAVPRSLGPFSTKVRPHGPLCVRKRRKKGGKGRGGGFLPWGHAAPLRFWETQEVVM